MFALMCMTSARLSAARGAPKVVRRTKSGRFDVQHISVTQIKMATRGNFEQAPHLPNVIDAMRELENNENGDDGNLHSISGYLGCRVLFFSPSVFSMASQSGHQAVLFATSDEHAPNGKEGLQWALLSIRIR